MEQALNNKAFVDALRAMIIDESPDNRKTMFDAIMTAEFLAPITFIDTSEVTPNTPDAKQFIFDALKNETGKVMFPVFTDADELNKMKKEGETPTVKTNIATYVKIFTENTDIEVDGVVVNPFGMSLSLEKEFFFAAANDNKVLKKTFDKETRFFFRKPRVPRTEMLEAIAEYLKYRVNVNKAYFVEMLINDESNKDNAQLLIVVDAEGTPNDVFEGIGKIAAPFHNGINLGMAVYNTSFGKAAVQPVEPFYIK